MGISWSGRSRRGSIPLVLGIPAVIAALAVGSMMISSGANRMDKRSDLHQKASSIASSAAEEVMLRLMNNVESWPAGSCTGWPSTIR